MKKDNVGFEYNLKNDNVEWDNVVKIAFDQSLSGDVRHQAFTLLRIRNIVQDGIDANGVFSGIKWDAEKGQIVEYTSKISDTSIGVDNILGGHSGRIYFSMPKDSNVSKEREGVFFYIKNFAKSGMEKYNDLLLDIVTNTKNAKNRFSNLGNSKEQTGTLIGTTLKMASLVSYHTYSAEDIKLNGLYSRLAATHGVKEVDRRASEVKLAPLTEGKNVAQKVITSKSSNHFGIDFASYDKNALVTDGNRGHMYINSTYTDNYSAFGIGLEGFAPGKGSHDTSGNADLYSAFGGPKYYIKVKTGDANFEEYIKSYCKYTCPNLNEDDLQKKIDEVKGNVLESARGGRKEEFKHASVDITDEEQINIVKSKDDSTYYIVSELAKKKLMDGDTLPKYHDGMRIIIAKDEEYVNKYEDNKGKGSQFLQNIETRRNEVKIYEEMEKVVMERFDKNQDGWGLQGVDGLNQEHLKKFLQEALCSKKENINELLYDVVKKVNKVDDVDKSSSMKEKNNNKKRSFSGEMKESNKRTHVDKQNNRSKSADSSMNRY